MTVDLFQVAKDLSRAHAELLRAGQPVTVESLLVEVRRCPSCAAPLICGACVGYCTDCGSEVSPC